LKYQINRWAAKKATKGDDELGVSKKKKVKANVKEELGFKPGQFAPKDKINKIFNNDLSKLNVQLVQFATDLFQLWDGKDFGKVVLGDITHNFLTLGFTTNEDSVYPFFTNFVRLCNGMKKDLTASDYKNCDIPIEQFTKLFHGDDYQQVILDSLNMEVRKKRYVEEGQKKQMEMLKR